MAVGRCLQGRGVNMNILMKMFQGGYVLQDGKIGHEFINLIKSDDNSFYIWLNSMGTFDKDETSGINILMIRTLSGGLYSVLGKAINCEVVEGANPKIYKTPEERYACQSHIKYNDKSLGDIHAYEKNTLVTFKTQYVYKPKKPIFITTNDNSVNNINIFKLNFKSKTSMREYIDDSESIIHSQKTLCAKLYLMRSFIRISPLACRFKSACIRTNCISAMIVSFLQIGQLKL